MKATSTILLAQLLAGITALLLATSCKKDKHDSPPSGEKLLQVNFTTGSIDYNLVDSGYVVLKKEGSKSQYFKRWEKKTNAISIDIEDLPAGNWTAEMYLFSRFDNKAGRRYRQDKTFTIAASGKSVQVNAPTGSITDAWSPNAFFYDAANGLSVAVALDNKDPHFDITVSDSKWKRFYLERYAYKRLQGGGGNALMAEGMYDCDGGCYTSDRLIHNNTAFVPFTQQLGNKEWDNGIIIIVIVDNQGRAVQFSYGYNK